MLTKYSDADLFEDIFRGFNLLSTHKAHPPANVVERQGGYEIRMLVPGYSKAEIKISAKSDILKIWAEKKQAEDKLLHKEYNLARFERTFTLPPAANKDAISALCEDGVLVVNIPLKDKETPKSLEIQVQ